ncbi:MAG: AmmeMemoRadiSam system protein B [Candidatus Gastranaerophilales bacterium]|nr:AmmeMemoRadiSam system protein B [Candidatus Gastranaerophilales bacterium]MCM1073423.1 AmmeMemoRadiSam system protein B [Bacteroides sp.]
MNKNPVFAGSFYPEKAEELTNLLESYKQELHFPCKSKAIIVPHAGIYYSGHAAMAGFQHLEFNENIFIITPSHHESFNNIALPEYTYFDTPLGSIEVNNRLIKDIAEKFPCLISNEVFDNEHSIEVQLPFLQTLFNPHIQSALDFVKELKKIGRKFKIIPVLVGNCDYTLISDLISAYWENSSFVISSDLSHFYPKQECRQIDTYTATIIETGKIDFFQQPQACGLTGIKGLVDFANNNDCSLIRIMMYNSGDISGESDRVVGYGSWYLSTETRDEIVEKHYSDYVLDIAQKSIASAIKEEEFIPHDIPPVLTQYGASFVTLKLNGQLRGCIGSVYPTKPLILDIIDNARNAAFQDPRFEPLTEDELSHLEISVSILSSIERINFKDERDLLSKIYPHGIILAERDRRAVYLPIVWEQLPDRQGFLNSLKEKAGLSPDYFSRSIEAYKFDATYISRPL